MEFRKVTISLPKNLYAHGMSLVNKGLFSNFSDLVRSGIREECKELKPIVDDFDLGLIYNDKKLIKEVLKSSKQVKQGKGTLIRTNQELDEHFKKIENEL